MENCLTEENQKDYSIVTINYILNATNVSNFMRRPFSGVEMSNKREIVLTAFVL